MAQTSPRARVPVQERGHATRATILAAARELFGERGFDATSLEAILAASGVKRGALYHHFPSKQAVFDAVLDYLLSEISAQMAEGYDPDVDAVDCLRAGSHAWLDLAIDPAVQRIVLLDAPVVVGWERWRELDIQHFEAGIVRDLERAGAPGAGAVVDAPLLAGVLVAAVNELALRVTTAPDGRTVSVSDAHATVDLLLDRLVAGAL